MTKRKRRSKLLKTWFNKYLLATTPKKLILAGLMAYLQAFLSAMLSVFIANNMGTLILSGALIYWSFFVFNIQRAAHGTTQGNIAFVVGASLGTWTGTLFVYNHLSSWFI